jgi:tetratricopeptide (TPR) repeat protein
MAKRKKKTRKQLLKEPDEFITFTSKLLRFVFDYKYQLASTLVGLIALILVATGIRYFSNKAELEAFRLLSQGQIKYQAILKEKGPENALIDVAKDFELIFEKYSSKEGAKLARVVYANMCYNAGDLGKAIALYDKSLKDFKSKPLFQNLILSSLGYIYEDKNDYKSAAKYFEMIASGADPVLRGEALFNLGRLYAAAGDHDKSDAAYKKILSDHSDSIYIELVKERIGN